MEFEGNLQEIYWFCQWKWVCFENEENEINMLLKFPIEISFGINKFVIDRLEKC